MALLARILLAAGLLVAVATAAPQVIAPHPLAEAHRDTPSFSNKTPASDHSVSQSQGSAVSNTEDHNESAPEEAQDTQNEDNTNGDTATTTTEGSQRLNFNPQHSLGLVGSQRVRRQDDFGEEAPDSFFGEAAPDSSFGETAPDSSFGETAPDSSFGETVPDSSFGETAPDSSFGDTAPKSAFGQGMDDIPSITPS